MSFQISELDDIFQCSVCLEGASTLSPRTKFLQCSKAGHLVCQKCEKRLDAPKKCPVCRRFCTFDSSVILDKLVDAVWVKTRPEGASASDNPEEEEEEPQLEDRRQSEEEEEEEEEQEEEEDIEDYAEGPLFAPDGAAAQPDAPRLPLDVPTDGVFMCLNIFCYSRFPTQEALLLHVNNVHNPAVIHPSPAGEGVFELPFGEDVESTFLVRLEEVGEEHSAYMVGYYAPRLNRWYIDLYSTAPHNIYSEYLVEVALFIRSTGVRLSGRQIEYRSLISSGWAFQTITAPDTNEFHRANRHNDLYLHVSFSRR